MTPMRVSWYGALFEYGMRHSVVRGARHALGAWHQARYGAWHQAMVCRWTTWYDTWNQGMLWDMVSDALHGLE